ncbi:MAG: FAD-dependent oxidoreductase, partial [Mycoplasmataceae bacterium]|nr:FAD-dependent oxidoreductase [Mycoplasmataceae bacterium]
MFLDKIKNKIENNEKNKIVEKYDVAIIGGGQTGLVLAKQLIKKEIKTLVIDKGDLGIKTSLDLRNFIKLIQRIISKNNDPKPMLSSFPKRLKYINEEQNKEIIYLLINNSYFKFIKGNVTTINEYSLIVDGQEIAFRKLVFATGSYFFQPENYPNLKREMYFNLDEVSKIDQFYENVAIYGTDVNALELAYAFALLGSNVYIFDENVNPFNNFDDDFESILKTDFMIDKINWCLESKITNHIQSSDKTIRIVYTNQGQNKFVEVNKIFLTNNRKSETR